MGGRMLRIALGGAIGTGLRLVAVGAVALSAAPLSGVPLSATPTGPLRLLALNVLGALLLGWVSVRRPLPEAWMPALTVGLLGGSTTFSTMVVQAGTLGHDAGLVAQGSGRMTGAGLALVGAYLTASVTLGLGALLLGRSLAGRRAAPGRAVTS